MKLTLHKLDKGENEVIVNYLEMNSEVEAVIRAASGDSDERDKILCADGETKYFIPVRSILYAESVDRVTYVCTSDGVYRTSCSLQALELTYADKGFFRCSKSMIINIYRISRLQSEPGGRINAELENGEHVIISRSYAKAFRRVLRGEE